MKVLMIDNYDSFTYNLAQYLGELGEEVVVRRNDQITVAAIRALGPAAVVISPGPCTPTEAGITLDVVRQLGGQLPILGVCLGHQAIGQALGAKIVRAPVLMHGKTSPVRHDGGTIFAGLPQPLIATRTGAPGATSGARGGTTSVGQLALRMTFSVTEPRNSR